MQLPPNVNQLWTKLLIEELIRQGVDYFCIAPGSRSAPLVTAAAENPRAETFLHFDERGLGFHALGHARATGRPVAVITTSGTAVANLLPAVIEASASRIPLIVLSADRPPELRDCGANQAIDQIKIFGDYVRWFHDLPCPSEDQAPEQVLTCAAQAVSKAMSENPGPVHVNLQFREPLAPKAVGALKLSSAIENYFSESVPFTRLARSRVECLEEEIRALAVSLDSIEEGLVVVGELPAHTDLGPVKALLKKLNWPVLPDLLSGLRLESGFPNLMTNMDILLSQQELWPRLQPRAVLHIGGKLVSKRANQFLQASYPRFYAVVQDHSSRVDANHQVRLRIRSDIPAFCSRLENLVSTGSHDQWVAKWRSFSDSAEEALKAVFTDTALTEPRVAREIAALAPADSPLFVAASMPIRDLEAFAQSRASQVTIASNRGTSGIDGTIATAVGFVSASRKAGTLLIGDLASLHDLNSLAMLKDSEIPLTIVVINNDGGGIFSFLPIAEFKKTFEPYFTTPHGLDFELAARNFGLAYGKAETLDSLQNAYRQATRSPRSTLIEVRTRRDENRAEHARIIESMKNHFKTKEKSI